MTTSNSLIGKHLEGMIDDKFAMENKRSVFNSKAHIRSYEQNNLRLYNQAHDNRQTGKHQQH